MMTISMDDSLIFGQNCIVYSFEDEIIAATGADVDFYSLDRYCPFVRSVTLRLFVMFGYISGFCQNIWRHRKQPPWAPCDGSNTQ